MSVFSLWDDRRRISFAVHLAFLSITIVSGFVAALMLWDGWFDSWPAAIVAVTSVEVLSLTSLVLYIAKIEWPLASLRHIIPFLSILPLGYELHLFLDANPSNKGGWVPIVIPIAISIWFVFLSFKLIHSLEGLFIDPVTAAREAARSKMQAVATTLAAYHETKTAAEGFAQSVMDSQRSGYHFAPQLALPLEEPQSLLLPGDADPRLRKIADMAALKDKEDKWLYTPEQLQDRTKADAMLVTVVCRMVRSGQLVVPTPERIT